MDDKEFKNQQEKGSFLKGVLFGVVLCVCTLMCVRSGIIIYKGVFLDKPDYEGKAKQIYQQLKEHYAGEIDEDKLYEGIYEGMFLETTDKYSYYIPKDAYADFKESTAGEYVGIGIVVAIDEGENVVINHILDGSPCIEAGVQKGDMLLKIEGQDITLENYEDSVDAIKGKEGTNVHLTFYRPEQDLTYEKTIKRTHIDTPTVSSKMLEDKIGYIRISNFDGVTYDQFTKALNGLKDQDMERLIVDVRDNPGGLLTSVTQILDEFLDEGVITYTEDKKGNREYEYSKGEGYKIPMVVLTSAYSASASELFSAALKDRGYAQTVGVTTYGKGVMQTTFPFKDGSALKMTTAKYYTPNGVCIDGIGVKPDYEVEAKPNFEMPYLASAKAEIADNDVQLEKAIEVVKNK